MSDSPELKLDNIDKQILQLLMKNAQMPYTEIAKKLFVSSGTVHVRMKKMIQAGVVKGSQLTVDHALLGYDLTAFVGIFLIKSSHYDEVLEELLRIPEVISCHYITGNYNMFIKIVCRDTKHLRLILHDRMQTINGIDRTETFISLDRSIDRPVPLEVED